MVQFKFLTFTRNKLGKMFFGQRYYVIITKLDHHSIVHSMIPHVLNEMAHIRKYIYKARLFIRIWKKYLYDFKFTPSSESNVLLPISQIIPLTLQRTLSHFSIILKTIFSSCWYQNWSRQQASKEQSLPFKNICIYFNIYGLLLLTLYCPGGGANMPLLLNNCPQNQLKYLPSFKVLASILRIFSKFLPE